MGEIAYGLRSHEELEFTSLWLHQEIDEVCCASFDNGPHRTQEISIENTEGVDVTSKGALISRGGII